MELRRLFPRLFMASAFVLAVVLLGNQIILTQDPFPARSWSNPDVGDETAEFQITFQVDEGDRLTIDVEAVLWNMGFHTVDRYEAYLFHSPTGIPGPAVSKQDALLVAQGEHQKIDTPTRKGDILVPEPPIWQIEAESWVTFLMVVHHGGRVPDSDDGRLWWGIAKMQDFVDESAPAGRETYVLLPAAAMGWQPIVNTMVGLGTLGILVGGVGAIRTKDAASGLEGKLQFAMQARNWLSQLSDQLWLSAFGLLLLAGMTMLVLGAGEFALDHALQPDSGYVTRTTMLLWFAFTALMVGFVIRLLKVRKRIQAIPQLGLDE